MPPFRSITIKQVAQAAGVSTQTVSRVLNDRRDVSAGTRERVRAVITELGYSPNAIARSLIQGRSHTLGVVAYGLDYYGPSHTLAAVERQASLLGYSLLLILLPDLDGDYAGQSLQRILARQVDGVLWAVPGTEPELDSLQQIISRFEIPVVCTSTNARSGRTVVAVDNYLGGQLAAEHLVRQGCRRMGIITGPPDWWESQARYRGWCDVLKQHQIEIRDAHCTSGDWSVKSGELGLRQLLKQAPNLEAIFACNDQMALGVYHAASQLKRSVPQSLAVVGFDDTPEASYYFPPLTTIHQDLDRLGALAVSTLHNMIEARQKKEDLQTANIWIKPELIDRVSSKYHQRPDAFSG